jgi:OOP family OmpA-OmpF porin
MNKNLQIGGVLSAIAAGMLLSGTAFAHQAGKANDAYVGDMNGHYITDSAGNCVKTSSWTKDQMTVDCGAEPAVEAKAPPPPPPPPVHTYETTTFTAAALFDLNKADLKPAGKAELDALADKITKNAKVVGVKIVGHTDSTGTEAYNQQLSERRAATVRDYAVSKGVNPNIISASGMGETAPVADNKTSAGRAKNRRVEITLDIEEQK